jgi:hypothetical protein
MHKKIMLSGLAARFYVHHGWTKELVDDYLLNGSFVEFHTDNHNDHYFILSVGSRYDIPRLLKDFPDLEIGSFFKEDLNESKEDLLKSRNW